MHFKFSLRSLLLATTAISFICFVVIACRSWEGVRSEISTSFGYQLEQIEILDIRNVSVGGRDFSRVVFNRCDKTNHETLFWLVAAYNSGKGGHWRIGPYDLEDSYNTELSFCEPPSEDEIEQFLDFAYSLEIALDRKPNNRQLSSRQHVNIRKLFGRRRIPD